MEIRGLTEFQKDLMAASMTVQKEIPKILRKVGSKGRTLVARRARSKVKKLTGNYHKKWKRGKVFKGDNGEFVVRVINSSPHAHLIEDGHLQVVDGQTVGFVRGKHVLKDGMAEFDASGIAEEMISDWLDDLLEQNKL
ncbi:HK97 gp10 family phage protein [Lysinibacillus sphaericus]|uniref:Histone acetyltransferase HPA2 n=1 Tax=Lysinibacillus sphaericus OT4b.31 TaxID=1285586 RepID=R7Z8G1_LYSSH|nr:HK97 gp10 family phage protein [Lysinibacillus sphaericus]EON70460.1 histone acetyltransferase HPA2 [Lysinibacillus sphaericus OT4b.31]